MAARLAPQTAAPGGPGVSSAAALAVGCLAAPHGFTAVAAAAAAAAGRRLYTTPSADEAWQSLRQTFTSIQAEVASDGVATLTLDRPQALNALNSKVRAPLPRRSKGTSGERVAAWQCEAALPGHTCSC